MACGIGHSWQAPTRVPPSPRITGHEIAASRTCARSSRSLTRPLSTACASDAVHPPAGGGRAGRRGHWSVADDARSPEGEPKRFVAALLYQVIRGVRMSLSVQCQSHRQQNHSLGVRGSGRPRASADFRLRILSAALVTPAAGRYDAPAFPPAGGRLTTDNPPERAEASDPQTIGGGAIRSHQNAESATDARGQSWPERHELIFVADDAFCRAELRVCGADASDRDRSPPRARA
jgi:hypothetical protein